MAQTTTPTLCHACNSPMKPTTTTFAVEKQERVYAVSVVPCLECEHCGLIVYEDGVARRLERYTSGDVQPENLREAWTFNYAPD